MTGLGVVPAGDNVVAIVPDPDRKWLAPVKEQWAEYWRSPVAAIVDRLSDMPAVIRLFSLRDERERCYRAAKDVGRMVEGSTGQMVVNPLYKHMAVLDGEIRQMETQLGLTPLARLKLGVTFGEAARTLADLNAASEEETDTVDDERFGGLVIDVPS